MGIGLCFLRGVGRMLLLSREYVVCLGWRWERFAWICGSVIYLYTPLHTLRLIILLAPGSVGETPHSIATPNTPIATTIAPPSAFITAAPVGVLVLTPVPTGPCVTVTLFPPPAPAVVMPPDVLASLAGLVCRAPDGMASLLSRPVVH